jgi:hypothetical protein
VAVSGPEQRSNTHFELAGGAGDPALLAAEAIGRDCGMIPRGNAAASSSSTDSTSEVTASVSLSQSACLLPSPPESIFCHFGPFPLFPAPLDLTSEFGATGENAQGLGALAP